MLTLADHPRLRLVFLCLLYVGQGIPYGFVTVALAAHLAARGAAAAAIGGVIAMAVLPWSFKWAWGPVVDSGRLAWLGRRRPWLIVAQAMMILTAAGIALVPETDIALLGQVILLHNVFVGLQDVAVDALAVDQLEGAARERASGMMFGSAYVGTFLGGAGLGIVTARFGLPWAIAALTTAQAALLALVLAVREQPRSSHAAPASGLGLLALGRGLARGMLAPQRWNRTDVVFGLVAAETICLAATTVAFFSIFMRVASPAVAATQFTASMAIMNLATSAGSWLAGPIGATLDTPTAFLIAGGVQPLLALLVPVIEVSPGGRVASD